MRNANSVVGGFAFSADPFACAYVLGGDPPAVVEATGVGADGAGTEVGSADDAPGDEDEPLALASAAPVFSPKIVCFPFDLNIPPPGLEAGLALSRTSLASWNVFGVGFDCAAAVDGGEVGSRGRDETGFMRSSPSAVAVAEVVGFF